MAVTGDAMPKLSDPFLVKGLTLNNRRVMAPMVVGMAEDFVPTQAHIEWYAQHARSGVGLVVVESCAIAPDGMILAVSGGSKIALFDLASGKEIQAFNSRSEGPPASLPAGR